MSILNDPNMIRAIISDHYSHPRNKVEGQVEGYKQIHMDSDSCVDDFYIYLKLSDDKSKVLDVKYSGVGCTISTASLSIISELVIGKSTKESMEIIDNYLHMINHDGEYNPDLLDEANVFENTYKQANRIKCASIGAHGIERLIKEEK